RERQEAAVLGLVANLAPPRMVSILFATFRIASGRLEMTAWIRTDPHVGPRRRNDESPHPTARRFVDRLAVRVNVAEMGWAAEAANAGGRAAIHVSQPRRFGGFDRVDRSPTAPPQCGARPLRLAGLLELIRPQLAPRGRNLPHVQLMCTSGAVR